MTTKRPTLAEAHANADHQRRRLANAHTEEGRSNAFFAFEAAVRLVAELEREAERDAVDAHFGADAVAKAVRAFLLIKHGGDEDGHPQTMPKDEEFGKAVTYTMLAAMMPEREYCDYCGDALPDGKKGYCSNRCAQRDAADWEATERDKYDMRYE